MRKRLFVGFCLLVFGSAAMAQKVDTKWHCAAPTANHTLDVGDEPGHSYVLGQVPALRPKGTGGSPRLHEPRRSGAHNHGRFNVTMDNGEWPTPSMKVRPSRHHQTCHQHVEDPERTGHWGMKVLAAAREPGHEDGSSDWGMHRHLFDVTEA